MDRKTSSIITDISTLNKDIKSLKSEQPFGSDTTELKLIIYNNITHNPFYDVTKTLSANERYSFQIGCQDSNDSYPFNIHFGYSKIIFQIWVNNMSTPYYGESSGIGVFTAYNRYSMFPPLYDYLETQIINSSAAPITIFIKVYAITTLTAGELIWYGL